MLVVTVDLLPHGDADARRRIGEMALALEGQEGRGVGDYRFALTAAETDLAPALETCGVGWSGTCGGRTSGRSSLPRWTLGEWGRTSRRAGWGAACPAGFRRTSATMTTAEPG